MAEPLLLLIENWRVASLKKKSVGVVYIVIV